MPIALFQNFGVWEILLLLFVLLLVFGPKRLPEMGRSLGRGMREFKDSVTGQTLDEEDELEEAELDPAPAQAQASTVAQAESEPVAMTEAEPKAESGTEAEKTETERVS